MKEPLFEFSTSFFNIQTQPVTGSFRITKLFNIPVKIHWTFGLLILWVAGSSYGVNSSTEDALMSVVFILTIFFCVLLHEYGHALTARKFGVKTRDIILLPVGGVARLEKLPEQPIQEFWVAIAGPIVNFVISILLLPYFFLYPTDGFLSKLFSIHFLGNSQAFIPKIIVLNLILGGFNLLPAFPTDGGRILRALLSTQMTRFNATRVASYVGQIFGLLFIFMAVNDSEEYWILGLFGFFIIIAARQELENVRMESILKTHFVSEIVNPTYTKLIFSDKMDVAAGYLKQGTEQHFLVFDEDEFSLIGSLSKESITKAIKSNDLESQIVKYSEQAQIPAVYSTDSLKSVYERLYEYQHPILPILQEGQIIGVVNDDLVDNFLKMSRKSKKA